MYFINGPTQMKISKHESFPNRDPFVVNSSFGDVTTAMLFNPSWKGSFEFSVGVNDSNKHSANAKVIVSLTYSIAYDITRILCSKNELFFYCR